VPFQWDLREVGGRVGRREKGGGAGGCKEMSPRCYLGEAEAEEFEDSVEETCASCSPNNRDDWFDGRRTVVAVVEESGTKEET
jgi:hypothetical protein